MADLKTVVLPTYTKTEEKLNAASHALGILFGIFATAALLIKSNNIAHIISSLFFGASIIVLYTASTLYHGLPLSPVKHIMRTVDHSVIYILIAGTSIPLMIMGVLPYNKIFGTVMIALSLVIELASIFVTFFDMERFKVLSMVLYMTLGWMCVLLIYPLYKYSPHPILIIALILSGGIVYTVGTTFLALGKKKRYFHFIFHIFVLAGTVLHFFGLYSLY